MGMGMQAGCMLNIRGKELGAISVGIAGEVISGGKATNCWMPRCPVCQWKCAVSGILSVFRLFPKTSGVQK